jgi:hypothetical protein
MPDVHHESVIFLIAPSLDVATELAKRFEGLPGVRVMQDRRRPWPYGERRRVTQATDPDRRRKQRRKSPRLRFEGMVAVTERIEEWHLR